MPPSQSQSNRTSFPSESSGAQPDAELGVEKDVRSNLTSGANAQPLRRDPPPQPEFPYTDLRPEARSPVTPDDPGPLVGDDATAEFDNGPSNPTEHASSEALAAATAVPRDNTTADDEDMHALHMEDAVDDDHK